MSNWVDRVVVRHHSMIGKDLRPWFECFLAAFECLGQPVPPSRSIQFQIWRFWDCLIECIVWECRVISFEVVKYLLRTRSWRSIRLWRIPVSRMTLRSRWQWYLNKQTEYRRFRLGEWDWSWEGWIRPGSSWHQGPDCPCQNYQWFDRIGCCWGIRCK